MAILIDNNIDSFLSQRNYDIRSFRNARWIDQKCTPDVLSIVADCIIEYTKFNENIEFRSKDIWHQPYTATNVLQLFSKPNVSEQSAKNEYDKFFQQPMELFAYAGILTKRKQSSYNIYSINALGLLDFIAQRERNALTFLQQYITKVLEDSGLYSSFNVFFINQDKASFDNLKKEFADFTIQNTCINGHLECNRIFTKILNPLAFRFQSKGTVGGYLSKSNITYNKLVYNRDNFRDLYLNKPKHITRQEYREQNPELFIDQDEKNYKYQSAKAKKYLKKFNDLYRASLTEHDVQLIKDRATNIHHIFPEADYPEISDYYENLIALTPTQHYNEAHKSPTGYNTHTIDETYQHLLLISKADRIKENLSNNSKTPTIYSFTDFQHVLAIGLDDYSLYDIENNDFIKITYKINDFYNNKKSLLSSFS